METIERGLHEGLQEESRLGSAIERRSAKVPSDLFLWLGAGSIIGSLAVFATGRRQEGVFVGMWAPTFLLLGIYNKLVKQLGPERRRADIH